MRKTIWGTRRRKVVAVLVIALVAVSSAVAGWIVLGNRSGATAKTSALPAAPVVSPSATPNGNLSPGGSTGLAVDVTNPNAFALTLTAIGIVNLNPNLIVTGDSTACPPGNFTVGFSAQSGLSVPIPVGGPTKVVLPGQTLSMAASAPTDCASRTITVSENGGVAGYDLTFST